MDRNLPLIGGRLQLEGAAAFKREAAAIEKQMHSLTTSLSRGFGSTAYFRGNIGPAAVYTRLPLTLGSAAAAAAVLGAAMTTLGAQFEKTTRAAQVFGQTTEAEMLKIADSAIDLSRDFTESANDITKGAVALGKAGADFDDLEAGVLKAATAISVATQGEISATQAGDLLTQSITALGLEWSDATAIADLFVGVMQNTTASGADLQIQLKQMLPIAGLLGYTFEEVAVTLGLLNQGALRGSLAGTALKNAIIALADPTEEGLALMQKYNISLFDAEGKALPLIEVIGRLGDAFGESQQGLSDAQKFFQATDIFNTRQILAALTVIKQGTGAFSELAVKARQVSAEQVGRDLQNNLIDQLVLIKNNLSAGALVLSGQFIPSLTNLATTARMALRENTLESYKAVGKEIDDVITLNNEFTTSIFRAVGPGPVALVGSLRRVISALGGDVEGLQKLFIMGGGAISTALIGISVAIDLTREELGKLSAFKDPFNTAELEAALQLNADRLIRFVALIQSVVQFYKQSIEDPINFDGLHKSFDQLFDEYHASLGLALGMTNLSTQILEDGVVRAVNQSENGVLRILGTYRERVVSAAAEAAAIVAQAEAEFRNSILPAMSNSMGFWDLPGVLPSAARPMSGAISRPSFGGSSFPSAGGGGGAANKPDLDEITAQVRQLLTDVPGLTDDLFKFIAGLAQDVPARLMPMVDAIKASRIEVGNLLVARQGLLEIDQQLLASTRRMGTLQAQQNHLDIQQAIAVIGYDRELLGLRHQLLEIDQQMAPLHDRLILIDREMARLQQENLVLSRQRIEAEMDIVPIAQQIEQIERRISELSKEDFAARRARVDLDLQALPIRQRIVDLEIEAATLGARDFARAREQLNLQLQSLPISRAIMDLENKITDSVDRRAALYSQLKSLDLADTEDDLAAAWERMDVAAILALEERKTAQEKALKGDERAERAAERKRLEYELEKVGLEEQLKPLERRLQILADTEARQKLLNDITLLGIEEQIALLQQQLIPLDAKTLILDREQELRELLNQITRIGLEEEKAGLEAILLPLQDKLDAINREIEAEKLRNSLLLTHLEAERRMLEEQLIPLEDQRRAIERVSKEIDLLRARAVLEFEERKIQIQAMILDEQLRQSELETTRKEQEALFLGMVEGFIASLTESQAFTSGEALEVAKRGRLWDEQVADIIESKIELGRVRDAAALYGEALDQALRDRTMTITTRYVTEGSPSAPGGVSAPAIDEGTPLAVQNASSRAAQTVGGATINNINNFNVDANYSNTQSPASISMDLRAMIMASSN